MNKKAMTISTLMLVILVMVVTLVIATVTYDFIKVSNEDKIQKCRASVTTATFSSSSSLDCPRMEYIITLTDDMIDSNGKVIESKVERKFADVLKNCWYKMGKGNAKQFDQNFINLINKKNSKDYACLVCSSIRFDDELVDHLKKDGNLVIGDFDQFLMTEFVNDEETYMDYFSLKRTHTIRLLPFYYDTVSGTDKLKLIDKIDTTKMYHVFYIGYTGSSVAALTNLVNSFSGLSLKADEPYGSMMVADTDSVRQMPCGVLVN